MKTKEEKRKYLHRCYKCGLIGNEDNLNLDNRMQEKSILKDYPRIDGTIIQEERIVVLCGKCHKTYDIDKWNNRV